MLERMEARGVNLIERAMRFDHQYVIPGCQLISEFFTEQGRESEAQKYLDRARRQTALYEAAQKERASIRFSDKFIPHNLRQEALAQLRHQLAPFQEVDQAYVVCKAVKFLPEAPLYVLGFTVKVPWYRYRSEKNNLDLCGRLAREIDFPGEFFVIFLGGSNKDLSKIMKKIEGSLIYEK